MKQNRSASAGFLGACILTAALVSSTLFAKSSAYKLFDLSCKKGERATGCEAPFPQCEFGAAQSIVETCLRSAQYQRCTNFTWEKCCATNCYIRNNNHMAGTEKCMDTCSKHAASVFYGPGRKTVSLSE